MNEIETHTDTFDKLMPEICNNMDLYAYEIKALQAASIALHEKAENDRLKAEGRVVVLPEPRLPLVWGDENHDTILCPCCKRDLMGGYLLDHHDHPMYQCPHCGQPIDDTASISTEDAEKAIKERENNG